MHVEKKNSRIQAGTSVLELMAVVVIILILAKFAVLGLQSATKSARNQTALTTMVEQMRIARQLAIDNRMVYVITFCGTVGGCKLQSVAANVAINTINIESKSSAGTYTFISTAILPYDIGFNKPGIAATPDGFGQGTLSMEFDCPGANAACPAVPANYIWFYPDGTGRDGVGNINNAVVYASRGTESSSYKAVTLYGGTGRIKGWSLSGGATWQ